MVSCPSTIESANGTAFDDVVAVAAVSEKREAGAVSHSSKASASPSEAPAATPGRALCFGSVAEEYDRFRPSPPPAALNWLLPERVALAIDLAAGTGALSRALLAWADEVIAVEPDARMRAVLARRLPSVRLLAGRAESLPLPDASADAVLVSSAWHWLDTDVAVPEIARVLRPGGWLGILWTGLDREDPRVAALWEVARTLSPHPAGHRERHRPEDVRLPASAPFAAPEIRRLRSTWRISPLRLAGLLGTYSSVITLPAGERARIVTQARQLISTNPALAGRTRIAVPLSCRCWRARRVAG